MKSFKLGLFLFTIWCSNINSSIDGNDIHSSIDGNDIHSSIDGNDIHSSLEPKITYQETTFEE